jgi:hypothetical protein
LINKEELNFNHSRRYGNETATNIIEVVPAKTLNAQSAKLSGAAVQILMSFNNTW